MCLNKRSATITFEENHTELENVNNPLTMTLNALFPKLLQVLGNHFYLSNLFVTKYLNNDANVNKNKYQ